MATIGLLAPLADICIAVVILILADWVTGLWKSYKCKRRFTSYRLRLSIGKLVTYLLAIYLAHLLDVMIITDLDLHLATYVAAYIGVTELVSIYENISVITGKELMKDIAKSIMSSVKSKIKKDV
jgi:phage-related holin